MDIVLATKNKKKIEEITKIWKLTETASRIYTLDDFPAFQDVKEDGATFEENAVKKAVHILNCTGMRSMADDSGLEVDALGGDPGVFSARYAGPDADDFANVKKLLKEMITVPRDKRGARFVCCIAMATREEVRTFMGYVHGRIGTEPKGKSGFGYDPVFYPDGHDRTFAEMEEGEKNAISHRAMALRELQKYLLEKPGHVLGRRRE